jgi:hypothetical protein
MVPSVATEKKPVTDITLYRTVIRPIVTYASEPLVLKKYNSETVSLQVENSKKRIRAHKRKLNMEN